MTFAGINYWAVLVAAVAGWGFGAVWYMALARPWMAAHGFTPEQMRAHHGKGAGPWPYIISFLADLVMAWVLAGLIGHFGAVNVKNGLISGAFVWLGFVITTLTVNNMFGLRSHRLIVIDGGHWPGRAPGDGRNHRRLGCLGGLIPCKSRSFRALSAGQTPSHNGPTGQNA